MSWWPSEEGVSHLVERLRRMGTELIFAINEIWQEKVLSGGDKKSSRINNKENWR